MVELYKLVGNKEMIALYEHRQNITRQSLPQLLTPAGYFVKSIEPDGIKHGVLGQKLYGYLEGVANAMMEVGPGYFRPIDQQKKEAIMKLYANSALAVYKGYEKRMEIFAKQGDSRQKRIASLFFEAQNKKR